MLPFMAADERDVPGTCGSGPDDVLSHRQLLNRGDLAGEALTRLGIGPGDPVAVLLPMCLESVVVTLACVQLGAVRHTLPVGAEPGRVRSRLGSDGARVVVTADNCLVDGRPYGLKTALDRELRHCPQVRSVLVVSHRPGPVSWNPGRDRWWHDALAAEMRPARPYAGVMSTRQPDHASPRPAERPEGADLGVAALVFEDPLAGRSRDDSDEGWGDPAGGASAAELARFLDEKPPHHI